MYSKQNISIENLKAISASVRQDIFRIIYQSDGGHYASSLSIVEILVALYFGGVMEYNFQNPLSPNRDRFILSKGQGAAALYSVLYRAGVFNESVLNSYCTPNGKLGGLASEYLPYGIELSSGSLGHGLGFSGGIALSSKLEGSQFHTFVLMGDGECQEGSVWEAALSIPQYNLGNITAIIDYNGLQAMDKVDNIISLTSLSEKWKAFGWDVVEIDGHNFRKLLHALDKRNIKNSIPRMIIAKTIKGKGISFMENSTDWHYRKLTLEQAHTAQEDLGIEE